MKIKAAILYEAGKPLPIEEVDLEEPHEGEVLVKLVGVGICHADLDVARGSIPTRTPLILGHEGAGIVEQVGTRVTAAKPGDHVVLTGAASCGKCRYCVSGMPSLCEVFNPVLFQGTLPGGQRRLRKDGQEINHFCFQSSFAEYSVVPQEAAIKVRDDAPLETIGFLGCGGMTGIGSVFNTARVKAGASVAIFGCGGVGMSALIAARLVGAGKLIAVDTLDNKLSMAGELGASHTVNATTENAVQRIKQLTDGGADYTFAAVGKADVIAHAFDAVRPGGTCVVIGGSPQTSSLTVNGLALLQEKTIKGCQYGSSRPTIDIPRYIDLFMDGKLPIDRLVTRQYPFREINDALDALEKGEVIKTAIVF